MYFNRYAVQGHRLQLKEQQQQQEEQEQKQQ